MECFDIRYLTLFFFDDKTSHFVIAIYTLSVKDINKEPKNKEFLLYNEPFNHEKIQSVHSMNFS